MVAVFDGHNDTLTSAHHSLMAAGSPNGHLDLPRMRQGGMRGGIFAVFTESPEAHDWSPIPRDDGITEMALAAPIDQDYAAGLASRAAGRLLALERAGEIHVARTIADIDAAREHPESPPVGVLHLEGAEAVDESLEALDLWYAAGLRSLGPVWSRSTIFGHGVPFISPSPPDTGPGLTDAGHALVARCSELGILVDLSHLNAAGFWNIAEMQPGPLVASHSGVHRLCPTSRNLTDEQLDAIGSSGGLVGIVYACPFLRADFADDPETPVELIARHAAYVAERIGVDHVALGSDFDGTTIPADVGDVAGLPTVLAALRRVGFSERDVERIAWENWRRVLDAWWH